MGPKQLVRCMLADFEAAKHLIETNKAFNHVPYNTGLDMLADLGDLIRACKFILNHTGIPEVPMGLPTVDEAVAMAQAAAEQAVAEARVQVTQETAQDQVTEAVA